MDNKLQLPSSNLELWWKINFLKDEDAWRKWVDLKEREWRDLKHIIEGDFKQTIKARAMFLALTPIHNMTPFYWNQRGWKQSAKNPDYDRESSFPNYLGEHDVKLKHFSDELLIFTFRLAKRFYDLCLDDMSLIKPGKLFKNKSRNWPTEPAWHASQALNGYNGCFLKILELLPDNHPIAQEVFDAYSFKLFSEHPDDTSEYWRPFARFMFSQARDTWKEKANIRMEEIIRENLSKNTNGSFYGYCEVITSYLWTTSRKPNIEDKQNLFSIDLFAKMVKFVSTLPDRKDAFKPWDVPSVLKILSDEKFKEVRRKFAHWLLFEQKEFSIYADGCEESLEMILKDFPEDQKLTSKAKRILAKYLEWKKEDTRETKSIKNAESRALESLKA